jgi:hypothetical protein
MNETAARRPALPFPTPRQRALGFLRATSLSYLAGGLVWALLGLVSGLAEGRPGSALSAAFLGFTYAGGVHVAASALPAAFLWAFLTPESSLTRPGPALFAGFLLGTVAGLLFGPLAPLVGLLYGMPTAALHLMVYRRLEAAHPAGLPARLPRTFPPAP